MTWSHTWRHAPGVLARVLLLVGALELLYLAVGNSLLASTLIRRDVDSEGLALEYDSAGTWLPGRVRVSGLRLKVEDYNVQFALTIDRAEFHVGLDELLHKRFHVFGLRADGVTFLMRHKVRRAMGHGARLAAFPKIVGFADPPLYRGPEPPPIPDDQYDLWQVHIEDVVARAKELWILEYRFRGDAEARGSFLVQPARTVRVEPARLTVRSGLLTVGAHTVARSVTGKLAVSIPNLEVQKVEGAAVFREISAQAQLELAHGDLDFINAYAEAGGPYVGGRAAWSLDAHMQRGVLQPNTSLVARARALKVTVPSQDQSEMVLSGPALAQAVVNSSSPEQLDVTASLPAVEVQRRDRSGVSAMPGPTLDQVRFSAAIRAVDLSLPASVSSLRVGVQRASFPNLYWLEPWLSPSGNLRIDGSGALSFDAACDASDICRVEQARFDFVGARIGLGERASAPLSGSLRAEDVLVPWHAANLAGSASLEVSSGRALMPLVTSLPIQDAVSTLLGLGRINARFAVSGSFPNFRLRLLEARSGSLTACGYYAGPERQARAHGALLMSAPLAHMRVSWQDGESRVSVLAGPAADWKPAPESGQRGRGRCPLGLPEAYTPQP